MEKDAPHPRSECPIACTLDIVGDKWTLLVLRDLLDGKRRFSEFERSAEHIPTNILTDRLKRLEAHGLLSKVSIEGNARLGYEATSKGRDMGPVLLALVAWGNRHIDETWVPPADYLRPVN